MAPADEQRRRAGLALERLKERGVVESWSVVAVGGELAVDVRVPFQTAVNAPDFDVRRYEAGLATIKQALDGIPLRAIANAINEKQ